MKKIIITLLFLIILLSGCVSNRDFRQDMRNFVQGISSYSKNINPDFIVITQNGQELLTIDRKADGNISEPYIHAIDGTGREDLFYGFTGDNIPTPISEQDYEIGFLNISMQNNLKVMVTDYCWTPSFVDDSYNKSEINGYISFAASHRALDNIPIYPSEPFNSNTNNIKTLKDAKNFLYLIDTGSFSNKNEFLNAVKQTNYDIILIDLFYEDIQLTKDDVNSLKIKKDGGERLVIAYMDIGQAENYRYYWKPQWNIIHPNWLLNENPNWPGDYVVKYWDPEWQKIIFGNNDSYVYKILKSGFNGVYLDNVDTFEFFENNNTMINNYLSKTKSHHIAN